MILLYYIPGFWIMTIQQPSSNKFIATSLRIAGNSCRIHVNNFMLKVLVLVRY